MSEQTDREAFADEIERNLDALEIEPGMEPFIFRFADRLLAAGFTHQPKPHVVETVEAAMIDDARRLWLGSVEDGTHFEAILSRMADAATAVLTPATQVHNHGTEEGDGLGCREIRLTDGRLIGSCLLPTQSTATDTVASAWDQGYWQGINGHTGPGNPYRDPNVAPSTASGPTRSEVNWRKVADDLAERLAHQADICPEHRTATVTKARNCPFCADTVAYRKWEVAAAKVGGE